MWTHCPERLLHTLGRLDGAESMLAAQESRQRLTVDIAHERERHRENLGYVTAPGACAFLLFVATASMEELAALRAYDEETRRHLATFGTSHIEARDAAYAACERGLEWVRERGIEPRILEEPGLIRLFALGWKSARSAAQRPPA